MDKHEPREAAKTHPVSEAVMQYIRGVEQMQAEIDRLSAQVEAFHRANIILESENQSLRMQLDTEKAERSYYQRFAVEVATSLRHIRDGAHNLGLACDDVIAKGQQGAYRKTPGGRPAAELPDARIPKFLTRAPAAAAKG